MRNPVKLALSFAVLTAAFTIAGHAQKADKAKAVGGVADVAAIKSVIDGAWAALGAQDESAFGNHVAPGWQLYTASGAKVDVAKLFGIHKANMKGFKLVSSNLDVKVKGSVAWATYDAVMSGEFKGKPWGGNFIMTNVFEKRNGKWVCVHMHESKKPEA